MVDETHESESQVREEAQQRDHRKLHDLLAGLLEEGSRSVSSVVSEPVALLPPQLINQVSSTQQCIPLVIPQYVRIRRTLKLSRHREVPNKL